MDIRRAKAILSPYMPAGAVTKEAVRAAFAQACRAAHPDTMAHCVGVEYPSVEELQGARNRWLQEIGDRPPQPAGACPVCRGTGYQSIQMKRYPCVRGCEAP